MTELVNFCCLDVFLPQLKKVSGWEDSSGNKMLAAWAWRAQFNTQAWGCTLRLPALGREIPGVHKPVSLASVASCFRKIRQVSSGKRNLKLTCSWTHIHTFSLTHTQEHTPTCNICTIRKQKWTWYRWHSQYWAQWLRKMRALLCEWGAKGVGSFHIRSKIDSSTWRWLQALKNRWEKMKTSKTVEVERAPAWGNRKGHCFFITQAEYTKGKKPSLKPYKSRTGFIVELVLLLILQTEALYEIVLGTELGCFRSRQWTHYDISLVTTNNSNNLINATKSTTLYK